jgi:hypothetical protein
MKKAGIVIFCMLLLLVLAFAGTVSAYNADYTHTLYMGSVAPVIDGTYIVDDDWISSGKQDLGGGAAFHDQWLMDPNIYCLLVEVPDNTDDAEDKLTVCFDGPADGGTSDPDGGANPTAYDKKLEITGHDGSETIQWFVGDGSGWVAVTASAELMEFAQSLTTTPTIETEHYCYEMNIDFHGDTSLGSPLVGYNFAAFVSYYDADTGETQQWPPADATPAGSPDVPDSWGYIPYEQAANPTPTIPETAGFVVMLAVSSVAVAGTLLLRKRKK